ncbi:unnamed protein product [Pedinophyceae sp. YPF-701]|nr:unnamed protein product [Pedinophyceae sp. YPF-701]
MGRPRNKGKQKHKKYHKQLHRGKFEARHIDQVWEDVRSPQAVIDATHGPKGTTSRAEHDDDTPGGGQHYCVPCARYFATGLALAEHERGKPHKRRVKELDGMRPHSQEDAERAAGMGSVDNGPRLRPRSGAGFVTGSKSAPPVR